MDTLPSGPKWWSTILEVKGYKTTDSIQLIWHDAEEITRSLFGNPIFGADMMFDPILITNALGQEYGEWFSACKAHCIQDSLLEGATITPVTRMTRGLEMHPLLISIGNIPGNIHMAATSHSWQCFDVPKGIQTILQTCIWHKCVDIITMGLKHLMIACISKTTHKQFGNSNLTLQHIEQVTQGTHLWNNLSHFQREVKTIQLSSVHLPFWRNWPFADPSIFLLPEILHTCHKFFFNHVLSWCRELLEDDLDVHFAGSVSHIKQMTGREHHDIQHTIVPMIAGCVPPQFLCAIHAIISFIYQAQSPIHTDVSVKEMESSLQEFHVHKDAIIKVNARKTRSAGTKNDLHILKLELFHSFAAAIYISKCLLITHCKCPFECTNKNKDFAEQVV
ncbi:hypothetical protein F5J12DRAFT_906870 [Pisolithus orientalis]|uniref:uncharacterized protein n=1 Tax=Pisolithus orientalis TaxID=936130 RepID=UPI0022248290|nr:uncharacterized protein F5J12DRAFT_906870 [Pisolithus orientalis]KAI5998566.1 hypothetical protein F5J12DRAFT_906870 [Pisolithus orientalis]